MNIEGVLGMGITHVPRQLVGKCCSSSSAVGLGVTNDVLETVTVICLEPSEKLVDAFHSVAEHNTVLVEVAAQTGFVALLSKPIVRVPGLSFTPGPC